MAKQIVEVVIDLEGNTTIAVTGVKGHSCTELTEELVKALGEKKSERKTREYYEQPVDTKLRIGH